MSNKVDQEDTRLGLVAQLILLQFIRKLKTDDLILIN